MLAWGRNAPRLARAQAKHRVTKNRKTVTKQRKVSAKRLSPVVPVRHIPNLTRILLFVRAGGRCEFDGCPHYLIEHPVTLKEGNFAEMAHIVAFRPDGPRGAISHPKNIHALTNLMLLCPQCHKLIDDHPQDYTRRTLVEYKQRHEKWIKQVTGLSPDQKTALLVFTSPIGTQTVSIGYDHMLEAVAPRYPVSREGLEIDLTNLLNESASVNAVAQEIIRERLSRYFEERGEWKRSGHISVFAIGPMPQLVYLGSQLSNKVSTDLFQRHRDTESWTWKKSGRSVTYKFREIRCGSDPSCLALLLCLSGSGPRENLPADIDSRYSVYELTLDDLTPSPTFLSQREDLERFRLAYQDALAEIIKLRPSLKEIDLFPAVPAPIAVLCGRETLPKVHPALRIHDYDKARNGFVYQLTVNT
jgi:hypothetical protein